MKIFIFFLLIIFIIPTTILAFSDTELDSLIETGIMLYENRNYREAITYFDRALEIDPNNTDVLNYKGNSLLKLNKSEEAITYFDRALEIDPNNFGAFNGKGAALLIMTKYIEAITYFDRALEIEPNNTKALNNKGSAFFLLDEPDESILHFQKSLSLDPDNIKAKANLKSIDGATNLKPVDGVMEITIRDLDNHLVGYLKTTNVSIFDHEVAWEQIENWSTKKIVPHNGKNSQLFQKTLTYPAPSDNAFGQSGFVLSYDPVIWLFFGHHYQIVAQEGEMITYTFTVFKPLE